MSRLVVATTCMNLGCGTQQAVPTRVLANREAHGRMGAPVLIEQDHVSGNLSGHMADVWRGLSDISGLAKSKSHDNPCCRRCLTRPR